MDYEVGNAAVPSNGQMSMHLPQRVQTMTFSQRPRIDENWRFISTPEAMGNDVPPADEKLAILGHEIRGPLSALSYALEALPSSMDDPRLTENLLKIMGRQVSQLTRLCNDLLDSGRIARGQLAIQLGVVNLSETLQNACEEIKPFLDQCGHTVTVALGDKPLTLMGDDSRLTQVFANVLHNSAKFCARYGRLHVSVENENGAAVIRFHDNGRGMSAQELRNLFVPDKPLRIRSEAGGEGLGIGLRLAKTIVELHDGTIEAFSEGLGHGSTFVVRLPGVSEISAEKIDALSLDCTGFGGRGVPLPRYRIVVVDDDRSMRLLMSRLLEKLDQSVTVADNGDTALKSISEIRPHVVFLDLQMHGISGHNVARRLRSRVELNSTVLIALSGSADAASRKRAAESGFDQYLVKPTSMAELTQTLRRIGELSTCERSLFGV